MLNRVFDRQTSLSGFWLSTKTARDGIQEGGDEPHVRTWRVQLRFDAFDELEHVFLIAARESERADRLLHGGESLVDLSQLQ